MFKIGDEFEVISGMGHCFPVGDIIRLEKDLDGFWGKFTKDGVGYSQMVAFFQVKTYSVDLENK